MRRDSAGRHHALCRSKATNNRPSVRETPAQEATRLDQASPIAAGQVLIADKTTDNENNAGKASLWTALKTIQAYVGANAPSGLTAGPLLPALSPLSLQ
ncbi:hypothetical protein PROAA_3140003 [Candidatus Propionivibrio aalborgensis]|uniref:Uncharacterized protein n=1 Tax=Candidatus Propionivibrio aalborgensis TaxID=1860101 RepID=A0A1A8XYV0_9RHOO|nr:hypothetical protein PROAA_3140003 [Candidatus Propionivibrio aalborgensis]